MKTTTVIALMIIAFFISGCKNESHDVLEENKEIVTNFYQEFFGNFNFDVADKYIGDTYIQHNPALADGREALINSAKIWFKDAPKRTIKFNLVMAEKDLVFVQIIDENDGNRSSIMDVFRVTSGKISEHWDAFATFKKGAISQNDNPLF